MATGQPPHPRMFGHEFNDIEQTEIARKADEEREHHDGREETGSTRRRPRRRWLLFGRRR